MCNMITMKYYDDKWLNVSFCRIGGVLAGVISDKLGKRATTCAVMLLLAAPTVSLHCTATVRKHRPLCAARLWEHSLIMKSAQGRLDQVFGSPCCAALDTVTLLGSSWCWLAPFCLQNYRDSSFHRSTRCSKRSSVVFCSSTSRRHTVRCLVTAEAIWAQSTHFTCEKTSRQKLSQNTRPCLRSFLLSKFWGVIVASVSCWEEWPPSDISHHQRRPANNHAMFTDTYITSFPFLMLSLNFSILTLSTSLNWVTAMWLAVYLR